MANTQLSICNAALRQIGVAKISALSDEVEQARILTDIYDAILDEVIAAHPWNFALKRATFTEVGGFITGWTEEGTPNVWKATLTTEPASVEFNNTKGTEQVSIAACTTEGYWYWASNVLYVYSESDPDDAYINPGIEAIIAEFGYAHSFAIPSGCLRVIRMQDDAVFAKEGSLIYTDEGECKAQYIAQITDPGLYSPAFVTALIMRLAAEIAYPLTNDVNKTKDIYQLYLARLKEAKAMDAQEGETPQEERSAWQEGRE